ncbi:MAG: lysophospholipid acyltransferase family protein [Candidatus Omnitrophota bacterium]
MLYTFLKIFGYVFSFIFFHLKVTGTSHIPKRGGFILAANHRSYLDGPLVALKIHRKVQFISKTILYRRALPRFFLNNLWVIPVRQETPFGLKSVLRLLKKGMPLVIFPEGTRNTTKRFLLPGSPGISLLAAGTGVPVIPAFIKGAEKALPLRARMFRPVSIEIRYGKPIYFCGDYQSFAEMVMNAIGQLGVAEQ